MWMLLFFALPFLALAYIGWHVWTLVPLPRLWRGVLIGIGVVCFMMTFLNFSRTTDRMPLWVGQLVYDIGNSTLFVLLYMPCLSTVIAIKNESGRWRWAFFTMAYTIGLAWVVSTLVFQLGSLLL
jgi:hypothetical protein